MVGLLDRSSTLLIRLLTKPTLPQPYPRFANLMLQLEQ